MIKKNGYRIELDEIEKVLCLHENILTAASILNKEGKLILFYTELTKVRNDNQYREHLLLYLPMYMMPDKFIKLDEFPQTSSHKINYQLLKAYEF
jgi:acyl-coenzyme A synthetase/AMP-(fatty) acid ligase